MALIIKNLKQDRIINLGTINGRMLCLAPGETKQLDKSLGEIFENRIITYAEGGFISVSKTNDVAVSVLPAKKPSKTVKNKTVVDTTTKNVAKEK